MSDIFFVGAAAFVLFTLEVFPLFLHVFVAFQFHVAFGLAVSGFDVAGDEVGEEERVHALALVFGFDSDEQQVDGVDFAAQRFEQVPPSEGENASAAFLQGAGEAGYGNADGDELVVGVNDYRDVVEAKYAQVKVEIVVDLSRCERRVSVKSVVGFVDEVEEGFAVFVFDFFA